MFSKNDFNAMMIGMGLLCAATSFTQGLFLFGVACIVSVGLEFADRFSGYRHSLALGLLGLVVVISGAVANHTTFTLKVDESPCPAETE